MASANMRQCWRKRDFEKNCGMQTNLRFTFESRAASTPFPSAHSGLPSLPCRDARPPLGGMFALPVVMTSPSTQCE